MNISTASMPSSFQQTSDYFYCIFIMIIVINNVTEKHISHIYLYTEL